MTYLLNGIVIVALAAAELAAVRLMRRPALAPVIEFVKALTGLLLDAALALLGIAVLVDIVAALAGARWADTNTWDALWWVFLGASAATYACEQSQR